jgi:hypothetical protein
MGDQTVTTLDGETITHDPDFVSLLSTPAFIVGITLKTATDSSIKKMGREPIPSSREPKEVTTSWCQCAFPFPWPGSPIFRRNLAQTRRHTATLHSSWEK